MSQDSSTNPEPSSEERAESGASAFPAAGETHDVGPGEREAALEAMPDGDGGVSDQVDTAAVDSDADVEGNA